MIETLTTTWSVPHVRELVRTRATTLSNPAQEEPLYFGKQECPAHGVNWGEARRPLTRCPGSRPLPFRNNGAGSCVEWLVETREKLTEKDRGFEGWDRDAQRILTYPIGYSPSGTDYAPNLPLPPACSGHARTFLKERLHVEYWSFARILCAPSSVLFHVHLLFVCFFFKKLALASNNAKSPLYPIGGLCIWWHVEYNLCCPLEIAQ